MQVRRWVILHAIPCLVSYSFMLFVYSTSAYIDMYMQMMPYIYIYLNLQYLQFSIFSDRRIFIVIDGSYTKNTIDRLLIFSHQSDPRLGPHPCLIEL